MEIIIALIGIALFLFFLEIFVPGMVLFMIGGILLFVSSIYAFQEFDATVGTLVLMLSTVLSIGMFFIEIKVLSKPGFGFMLRTQNNAVSNVPATNENLVGKTGETLTIMAPSGLVMVENKRYQAFSKSGHLDRGRKVRVISQDAFKITVQVE